MMTQDLNVCVLAAPLAAIDRRALPQAWYSALHCASEKRPEPAGHAKIADAGAERHATDASFRKRRSAEAAQRTAEKVTNEKVRARCDAAGEDRRARRSPLARRIERKFLDPKAAAQRATFIAGGKRVHVMVHVSADRVRLVAVCPPGIREAVTRALAQARFTLASRGVTCS